MTKRSLYEKLGLLQGATLAQIRAARRERAKKLHPDVGGKAEDFQEMQRAYLVLSDPKRRAKYDSTGDETEAQPDLHESLVLGIIHAQLMLLLAQPLEVIVINPVVEVMRASIGEEIKNLLASQAEAKKAIGKIERVEKRFRRRTKLGDKNILFEMLQGQKRQHEQMIERVPEQIKLREEARAILADYEFDRDQVFWQGGGASGMGASGRSGQALGNIFDGFR